ARSPGPRSAKARRLLLQLRGAVRCPAPARRRPRRSVELSIFGGHIMAEMFTTLGTWNWLIFGFILMALELLAPGVFLFWLGLAALLVGLLSFVIHPSWQTQLLMFAVFAVAAVPLWRRLAVSTRSARATNPFLNKRTDALLGRAFTLAQPLVAASRTVRTAP